MSSKASVPARQRLLEAANKLFYDEGIHTVGIDRIIEKAGVAKASLYSAFGSKDELVRVYLAARFESRKKRTEDAIARHRSPRARILSVFDVLGEVTSEPSFRGCPFLRASAEGPPDKKVKGVCDESRTWLRTLFTELADAAGAVNPELVAQQLALLYDGVVVSAQMDRDPTAATAARELASTVLDAAIRRGLAK